MIILTKQQQQDEVLDTTSVTLVYSFSCCTSKKKNAWHSCSLIEIFSLSSWFIIKSYFACMTNERSNLSLRWAFAVSNSSQTHIFDDLEERVLSVCYHLMVLHWTFCWRLERVWGNSFDHSLCFSVSAWKEVKKDLIRSCSHMNSFWHVSSSLSLSFDVKHFRFRFLLQSRKRFWQQFCVLTKTFVKEATLCMSS